MWRFIFVCVCIRPLLNLHGDRLLVFKEVIFKGVFRVFHVHCGLFNLYFISPFHLSEARAVICSESLNTVFSALQYVSRVQEWKGIRGGNMRSGEATVIDYHFKNCNFSSEGENKEGIHTHTHDSHRICPMSDVIQQTNTVCPQEQWGVTSGGTTSANVRDDSFLCVCVRAESSSSDSRLDLRVFRNIVIFRWH